MARPIKAHIDLTALKHNYNLAKKQCNGPALAVIKANAYGHGAVQCARALASSADGFAVASLEEARELREAGIQLPIVLLEGFFDVNELAEIEALNCWLVIHSMWQVSALMQYQTAQPWQVWLKIDTGMHRLGLAPDEAVEAYSQLKTNSSIYSIKLMTHFANADDVNDDKTKQQMQCFQQVVDQTAFTGEISIANSAAILGWSALNATQPLTCWARPGLMLYGANPFYGKGAQALGESLQAVMTLSSKLIAIQAVKAGDCFGYGGIYQTKAAMRIGVVACGYADGYPRTAINAPVWVRGQRTQVVGRVSMDMLFVDLTTVSDVEIGDDVELWGKHVSVDAVAASANTLAYELLCNVKRAPFFYR